MVLTRKGIDAMCKAYKKRRKKRRDAGDDETEASADESRADPGTAESEQTASGSPPRVAEPTNERQRVLPPDSHTALRRTRGLGVYFVLVTPSIFKAGENQGSHAPHIVERPRS